MPILLISLVLFSFFLIFTTPIFSDELILPKEKPSVFKKIERDITNESLIIPNNKPVIVEKKETISKKKDNTLKKVDEKIVKSSKVIVNFLLPQKKPKTYKKITSVNKSKFLNEKDFQNAKIVFEHIKNKKWITAYKSSFRIKDNDFKTFIKWLYLLKTGNNASFNDYVLFIKNNSDYPRIGRLQYLGEQKINLKSSTPNFIINWFNSFPPVSGAGKLKHAEALLSKNRNENIDVLIKQGWITADLNRSQLKYYKNKFKSYISTQDFIKRAEYLSWEKKYWDLKRMLIYLPKDYRALYNARQILMSNSYGVDNAIAKVPEKFKNDIGLQYDRLKWRNRRGRLESSLQILYENSNKSEDELKRADLWWKQRESIVRSLIYKKRYKTAYKIASEHSLTSGPEFAEAEWLSGWVAHSFLKSQEYAINHFLNFYDNVSYPISLARGAFWLGKSYKALGNDKIANDYFLEGSKFLTTYYGQLSLRELDISLPFELSDDSTFSKEYENEFKKNKLIKIVKILKELDQTRYTKDIIKHLASLDVKKGSEVLAAQLAIEVERYDFAIQISKKASYEKRFYLNYNYPIITTPRQVNSKIMPSPELILAIIRQESEFDRKAYSYAGARGMMQLMKYTAKLVAKQAGLPYSISGLTQDPEYNIKLGTYYFNSLLENYGGVYPFAIAAYNAGPNRVKTWRRINGDPTKGQISYIDWIELIRFKETRNYVQRVLENVNVYKYMISKEPIMMEGFIK